jgi:hypothetical protein
VLVEAAKPITFLVCIVALCAAFNAAFLDPSLDLDQRLYRALARLLLAGGACVLAGIVDRLSDPRHHKLQLWRTLPMRVFCWASTLLVVLFGLAWYLETYCVFYRDVRVW